jgi:hypothetical protein
MRRSTVPGFFALEPLLAPINVATLGLVVAPSRVTAALLGIAIVLQTVTALVAAWTIRGRPLPWRYAPLEVVRTFVMLACWATGWLSRTIVWRGHAFTIGSGSAITPVTVRDGVDVKSAA